MKLRVWPFLSMLATSLFSSMAWASGSHVMDLGDIVPPPPGFRIYCAQTADCISRATPPLPRTSEHFGAGAPQAGRWATAFAEAGAHDDKDLATEAIATRLSPTRSADADTPSRGVAWLSYATAHLVRPFSPPLAATGAAPPSRPPIVRPGTPAGMQSAPGQTPPLEFNSANQRLLQEINLRVNSRIRPAADQVLYGALDVWTAPDLKSDDAAGDCEDYVLAKRDALIQAGVAPDLVSIAVVRTSRGQSHAILVVDTTRGDYVLDNLSFWVRPSKDVPYRWIMRQNHGHADEWRRVVNAVER